VAQRSQFFDSSGGDRIYTSDALAQMVERIALDGVVEGDGEELLVSPSSPPAMSVRIGLGSAFIQGRYFEVYGSYETLAVGAAHASLPRIDRVVARLSSAARSITLAVKSGTPAASPAAPALQQDATVWEIPLANVAVGAGATAVQTANITDARIPADTPLTSPHQRATNNPHATTAVQVGAVSEVLAGAAISVTAKDASGRQTISTTAQAGAEVNQVVDVQVAGAPVSSGNPGGVTRAILNRVITLTFNLATAAMHGLMSAAHFAMLSAATPANAPGALALRDGNGDIAARLFVGSLSGNAASASYATAAAALAAGADRNKLDSLNQANTLDGLGWRMGYFLNGRRYWTREFQGQVSNFVSSVLGTVSCPAGWHYGQFHIQVTVVFSQPQQVTTGFRFGNINAPSAEPSGATSGELTARSTTGQGLQDAGGNGGWWYAYMTLIEK
jgi:hypothetical protein